MENKTTYTRFLERVDTLSTGARVALKRSAGIMLPEADGKAIAAFYRCAAPTIPQWQEDRWFAAACLKCLWEPGEHAGEPVEKRMAQMIQSEERMAQVTQSEEQRRRLNSMERRVEGLLDTQWDSDGFMLTKLCRMIKMLRQKSPEAIDFAGLLEDLIYWNNENQSVQRKWARAIFSPEK